MLDEQTLFVMIAALLIGLSKGGLGGPLPVALVVPLLSQVMPTKEAIPVMLPFLIFADLFALYFYWNEWDLRQIRLLIPSAVVGVIMGGLLLSRIDPTLLKIIIGVFTILIIVYKLVDDRLQSIEYQSQRWHGYLTGWSTAFASTLASTGGPTITIYLLLQGLKPVAFLGTSTLFFATVNLLKIPIYAQQDLLQPSLIAPYGWILVLVPIGVGLGRTAINYISPKMFERIMMILLVGSVILLFRTL